MGFFIDKITGIEALMQGSRVSQSSGHENGVKHDKTDTAFNDILKANIEKNKVNIDSFAVSGSLSREKLKLIAEIIQVQFNSTFLSFGNDSKEKSSHFNIEDLLLNFSNNSSLIDSQVSNIKQTNSMANEIKAAEIPTADIKAKVTNSQSIEQVIDAASNKYLNLSNNSSLIDLQLPNIKQTNSVANKIKAVEIPAADIKAKVTNSQLIEQVIDAASNKYDVDPDLIRSVIRAESNFKPDSTSAKGAMGLMQLMPETAKDLGVERPYDISENVMGGTNYLKTLLDRYEGNIDLALAAYNWGMGNLERNPENLPRETRDYIAKINKFLNSASSV